MSITNIGFFGKRNVGKSSVVNMLLGQDFSIVSDTPGTTTDPVKKRIEIFGLGPCQLIDTAGVDDLGELGKMRVAKSMDVISQVDVGILVFNDNFLSKEDKELLSSLKRFSVPVIALHNKSEITPLDSAVAEEINSVYGVDVVEFSTKIPDEQQQMEAKELLISFIIKAASSSAFKEKDMFEGLVSQGDKVLLICPIDSEAPTGRLILPQVNAIRSLLDKLAVVSVVQPQSLHDIFKPGVESNFDLVVTDSQIFGEVSKIIPQEIPFTSFSMLLARSKGCFEQYIQGTPEIEKLKDGDRVLILESCTHHSSCEDIGRVKLPNLFKKYTGKALQFDVVAGLDAISRDIKEYAIVAQCGGCMITSRQLYSRLLPAIEAGVPVTNYGMAISYMNGIFNRAIAPLLKNEI